jgi:hypothetical protein
MRMLATASPMPAGWYQLLVAIWRATDSANHDNLDTGDSGECPIYERVRLI